MKFLKRFFCGAQFPAARPLDPDWVRAYFLDASTDKLKLVVDEVQWILAERALIDFYLDHGL